MIDEMNKKNIYTSKLHTILKTLIDGLKKYGVYERTAILVPVENINELADEYCVELWKILLDELGCEREDWDGPMYITKEHCANLEIKLEHYLKKYTNPKIEEQLKDWEPPEVEGRAVSGKKKKARDKSIYMRSGWFKKCLICKEEELGPQGYRIEGHPYPVCKRCYHEDLVAKVGTLRCVKCKDKLISEWSYSLTEDGPKCPHCIREESIIECDICKSEVSLNYADLSNHGWVCRRCYYEEQSLIEEKIGAGTPKTRRPKKEIDIKKVHELKQKGLSIRKIARILKVSHPTILKKLKKSKKQKPKPGRPGGYGRHKIKINVKRLLQLDAKGLSTREIARILKISHVTVYNKLKEIKEQQQTKKLIELTQKGQSIEEIADSLDISNITAYSKIKKLTEQHKIPRTLFNNLVKKEKKDAGPPPSSVITKKANALA